jgi:Zn-dependent protease with chaperone function
LLEELTKPDNAEGNGSILRIKYVHASLPAGKAGFQAGGRLVMIDGQSLDGTSVQDAVTMIRRLTRARLFPVAFAVEQQGEVRQFHLEPMPARGFGVAVTPDSLVLAFANGRTIVITIGMLAFAKHDDELAFILAHELAHNALRHNDSMRLNAALGSFLAASSGQAHLLGGWLATKSLESQADYVAIYMLANAGFDLQGARTFWNRMSSLARDVNNEFVETHPKTSERLEAYEQMLEEIEHKKRKGELLTLDPEVMAPLNGYGRPDDGIGGNCQPHPC